EEGVRLGAALAQLVEAVHLEEVAHLTAAEVPQMAAALMLRRGCSLLRMDDRDNGCGMRKAGGSVLRMEVIRKMAGSI
ncbi:MAG: hypothetical protein Q4D90_08670, partial [bacterium]|nr:hypothetical protein [bacterium]